MNKIMKTHIEQYDLAKQKFNGTLAKLYHQYEKIWEENLSLHKVIEDLKKRNVLNQKSKNVEKENIKPLYSKSSTTKEVEVIDEKKDADTSSKILDPADIALEYLESDIPEVMSLEFNSDSEPTPSRQAIRSKEKLEESKTFDNLIEDEDFLNISLDDLFEDSAKALSGMKITSPVITKSRRRRKRPFLDNKSGIDSDANESMEPRQNIEIPVDDFEDAMCKVITNLGPSEKLTRKPPEPNDSMSEDIFATTDDEIDIIGKPKICRKLTLNKSNVGDVEILQGRKLVQSKLVLQKAKQKPESLFTLDDEDFSTNWISQNNRAEVEKKTENPAEPEAVMGTPMRTFKPKPSLSLNKSKRSLFASMISNIDDDKEQKESEVPDDEATKKTDAALMKDLYVVVPNPMPGPSNQSVKRKLSDKSAPEENSSINDETFFSPGEQNRLKQTKLNNESCDNEEFFTSPECETLLGKEKAVTVMKELPYIEKAVRGKAARAQLEGWDCWECEKFYKGMGYTEEEMKKFRKTCSRHRSKFNQRVYTPAGFWDPVFQNKYTQSEKG